MRRFALILLFALPLAAQTPAPTPPDDLLQAALWTQRAAEHDLVFRQIYRNATEKIRKAIADKTWNALPTDEREKKSASAKPPAVILDVDETALDNSPYETELIRSGKEYEEFTWKRWCNRADAKALPGAAEFAQYAAKHGVAVYYISNRAKDLQKATVENLRNAGFPVSGDDAFLGLGTVVSDCEQSGSDKDCRRRLVGRTHRVLMQFGDQLDDFVVIVNTPEGRAKSVQPYLGWIGERWWVLPNPMYGSWEAAQFNNDWSKSRDERRRAKIDALR